MEDYFYHVHNQRTDDINLTYAVEQNTNLISNGWSTNGVEFVGEAAISNPPSPGYGVAGVWKTVTNRTGVGEAGFVRLRIGYD